MNLITAEMEHKLKSFVPETKSKKEARQLEKLRLRLSFQQQQVLVREKFQDFSGKFLC